jgi:nucleotide-binding universal stress UspA family protein
LAVPPTLWQALSHWPRIGDFRADLARRPPVVTPTCWHGSPEDAILRQARLGPYDLVVMGVGRPAGETLYFGKIAAAVLENSQHSILFVSS